MRAAFFLITHDWFRYGTITVILAVALLIPASTSKAPAPQRTFSNPCS